MSISERCFARGEDWAGGQQQVGVEQGDASCCHGDFCHLGHDVVPELRGRCGLAGVAAMPCHWGEHLIVGIHGRARVTPRDRLDAPNVSKP